MGLLKNSSKNEPKKSQTAMEVGELAGWTYEEAYRDMKRIKDRTGISFKSYKNNKLYEYTYQTQLTKALKIMNKRKLKSEHLDSVFQATGMDKEQAENAITGLEEEAAHKISLAAFDNYKLYDLELTQIKEILNNLDKRKTLCEELYQLLNNSNPDEGKVCEKEKEYKQLIRKTLLQKQVDKVKELAEKYGITEYDTEEQFTELTVDQVMLKDARGFTMAEYFMFDFSHKTLMQKNEFLSRQDKLGFIDVVNNRESKTSEFTLLKDKFACYERLSEYYKRDAVRISSKDDFKAFKKFCKKNPKFVKKPLSSSFGNGVELIDTAMYEDLQTLFDLLRERQDKKDFIIEGLIYQAPEMACLHPGSVNGIRLVTYFDGEKTVIHRPFVKIGRGGSFVDNGGAGGILACIDSETGVVCTDGYDELRHVFTKHPDTGIEIKGFQIPEWNQAVELGKKIANSFKEIKYIGWDLAYTKDNGWVIIEGNGSTQFIGQQMPSDTGIKKELKELTGL